MTRREKFRLALAPFFRTHPLHDHCEHEPQALSKWGRCSSFTELLNDLERACGPEPRREELNALLRKHLNPHPIYVPFVNDLMAWATGATEPQWCKHLTLDPTTAAGTHPRYRFTDLGGRAIVDWNEVWKVCPICQAPRPAGA